MPSVRCYDCGFLVVPRTGAVASKAERDEAADLACFVDVADLRAEAMAEFRRRPAEDIEALYQPGPWPGDYTRPIRTLRLCNRWTELEAGRTPSEHLDLDWRTESRNQARIHVRLAWIQLGLTAVATIVALAAALAAFLK